MALRNRVTPDGRIVAAPWRGRLMGNRGRLHEGDRLLARRWTRPAWVTCTLDFRGRRRAPMPERGYTTLFFWDEAAAFAAGHVPCFECRRPAARAFAEAWARAGLPGGSAAARHRHLHAARIGADRAPATFEAEAARLPAGVFVRLDDAPVVLTEDAALAWREAGGYAEARGRPRGRVTVLTPAPVVAAFRAGYRPAIDATGP